MELKFEDLEKTMEEAEAYEASLKKKIQAEGEYGGHLLFSLRKYLKEHSTDPEVIRILSDLEESEKRVFALVKEHREYHEKKSNELIKTIADKLSRMASQDDESESACSCQDEPETECKCHD